MPMRARRGRHLTMGARRRPKIDLTIRPAQIAIKVFQLPCAFDVLFGVVEETIEPVDQRFRIHRTTYAHSKSAVAAEYCLICSSSY